MPKMVKKTTKKIAASKKGTKNVKETKTDHQEDGDISLVIKQSSVRRLAQRARVSRVGGAVFPHVRQVIKDFLKRVLSISTKITTFNGRSTVTSKDVYTTFRILNIPNLAGVDSNNSNTTFKTFSSSRKKKVGKTRRSKTGTEAKRDIAFQIRNSEMFGIPRANFSRLVRLVVQEFGEEGFRFNRNSIDLVQLVVESLTISLFETANAVCVHAGRKTVETSDIDICRVVGDNPLFHC